MPTQEFSISRGSASPMGATFDGNGVNFAVFSEHAEKIELCLFSESGRREVQRLVLPERAGDVWYGYVTGLQPGAIYGFRVYGPYAPEEGHRFNPNKLLLDPYGKKIAGAVRWSDSLMGYRVGSGRVDLSFDQRDSAHAMPKSVVQSPLFDWSTTPRPNTPLEDTIIFEAHPKGLTAGREDIADDKRGYFLGLSSPAMLDHLTKLGITAIELLPPQAFVDDQFLIKQGLRNYWGYSTIGFFCPEPRYLSGDSIAEFQMMVSQFHKAGIEVLIDVVYNHTAEGSELGPTLCHRGFDNLSYYKLRPENLRYCENFTGTGNTLNVEHPMVLRMVIDSLRYWVDVMGVDGFRFDLASTLGRTREGFDRNSGFFKAVMQDPVLSRVKLIAEPWDIGPGGYQLGAYPDPFLEWNDKYRDGVRQFWRGDVGMTPELARRLVGSAEQFDHAGRAPTSSVNFLTAHDGFSLEDTVSYIDKHNEANGEGNADGHDNNHSTNNGAEGKTDDPEILARRAQHKRNLLTTLLLSQGTPMLLAGDEIGNSQGGNNNAYCQDNEISWVNWDELDASLLKYTRKLLKMRKSHSVLRQRRFLHSNRRAIDGMADLFWRLPDGRKPTEEEWSDPERNTLCLEIRTGSDVPEYDASMDGIFAVLNSGGQQDVVLPPPPEDRQWVQIIDSTDPDFSARTHNSENVVVPANSVAVYALEFSR